MPCWRPRLAPALAGVFEAGMYEVRARMRALQGRYEEAAADLVHVRRLIGDRPDNIQFTQPMAFAQGEIDRARRRAARGPRRGSPSGCDADPEGWNSRYGWPLIWLGMRVEVESGEADPERVAGAGGARRRVPGARPASWPHTAR